MKIPVLPGPSVRSVDLPGYTPRDVQADYSVARGIRAAGGGMAALGAVAGEVVTKQLDADAKAKKEAEALVEADSMLEQHKRAQRRLIGDSSKKGRIDDAFDATDTSQGGFLAKKGLDASKDSSTVLDELERDRQEIADLIPSPEAKERFLRRSAEAQLGYSKQVETHVNQQFEVAKQATLKGRISQALSMSEGGVTDFDSWLTTSRQVEHDLVENAPSPEAGKAAVAEFRSQNAVAFAQGLTAKGDLKGAHEFIEAQKATFGTRYKEVSGPARKAFEGWQKDQLTIGVSAKANEVADFVRDEFGISTGQAMRNTAPRFEIGDPRREAMEAALEKQTAIEHKRLEDGLFIARNAADAAHYDGKAIPAEAEMFLKKYDASYLTGLRSKAMAERRAARTEREGSAREKREAITAQANTDKEFLELYNAAILTNPSLTPKEYAVRFAAEKKASSGQDVTVTSLYLAHGTRDLAELTDKTKTKEGTAEVVNARTFANEQERDFEALLKKKGAPVDANKVQQLVGRSMVAYNKAVRANGGKPLDEKQLAKLKAELTGAAILDPGVSVLGLFQYGKRTGFGAELVKDVTEDSDTSTPSVQPSKLAPGRYQSTEGKFFIVDEQGNKRAE